MTSKQWIARGEAHVAKNLWSFPAGRRTWRGLRLWDVDGQKLSRLSGRCGGQQPRPLSSQGRGRPAAAGRTVAPLLKLFPYPQPDRTGGTAVRAFLRRPGILLQQRRRSQRSGHETGAQVQRRKFRFDRFEVITALASFHGRTIGTISATGQDKVKAGFNPMLPGFHYVPFGDAEALRQAITPRICAVMLEPVQGEGGVRVAPPRLSGCGTADMRRKQPVAGLRRSTGRLRPYRFAVRLPAGRRGSGYHDPGQGPGRRPAHRRHDRHGKNR